MGNKKSIKNKKNILFWSVFEKSLCTYKILHEKSPQKFDK